ncbi:MAG: hypothetical protein NZT61_02210 [Deltaproteobacteria bacterium]|nr:hypothetical protein [Deltaproteobacteria bacterium]
MRERIVRKIRNLEEGLTRDEIGDYSVESAEKLFYLTCYLFLEKDLTAIGYASTFNGLVQRHKLDRFQNVTSVINACSVVLQGFTRFELPFLEPVTKEALLAGILYLNFSVESPDYGKFSKILDKIKEFAGDEDIFISLCCTFLKFFSEKKFPFANMTLQTLESHFLNFLAEEDINEIYRVRVGSTSAFFSIEPVKVVYQLVEKIKNGIDIEEKNFFEDVFQFGLVEELEDSITHDLGIVAGIYGFNDYAKKLLSKALSQRIVLYGEESEQAHETQKALESFENSSEEKEQDNFSLNQTEASFKKASPNSEGSEDEKYFLMKILNLIDEGRLEDCKSEINRRLSLK